MDEQLKGILRAISGALQTPVIIVLLLLMAATVFMLGTLVAELFTYKSALAKHRERLVSELLDTPSDKRANRASALFRAEKAKREGVIKLTDGIARLGPMFGLLGTLIPLGPGIIALGRGDTYTLSQSLLTAFDTTVAGLISAAVAFVISGVRKRLYSKHLAMLEHEMENVLDGQV
jgi:biopolymer transport protein ExbB/TolQ